jgi:hypothetical protein
MYAPCSRRPTVGVKKNAAVAPKIGDSSGAYPSSPISNQSVLHAPPP